MNYRNSYLGVRLLIEYYRKWLACQERILSEAQSELSAITLATIYLGIDRLETLADFESNDYFKNAVGVTLLSTQDVLIFCQSDQLTMLIDLTDRQFKDNPREKGESSVHWLQTINYRAFAAFERYISFFKREMALSHTLPEFRADDAQFLTADETEHLETHGYLVKEAFLSPTEVEELRLQTSDLARVALEAGNAYVYGNGNKLQRVYNLIDKAEVFRSLVIRNEVLEVANSFFHRDTFHSKCYLSSFQANILNPGALEQVLHVDASVPDPLPPWKIRLNINFLIDDFTETNGATLVTPGSHLYLRKPTWKDAQSCQFRKLLAPKGSMVIWNGHLWHKSGSNFSQASRAALLACFSASFMREIAVEENYLEVMDRRRLEASSETLKELVGFNHGRKLGA